MNYTPELAPPPESLMSIDTEESARVALPQVLEAPSRKTSPPSSAYDRVFWLTYLANGLITVANALLVRYADFVTLLGGEERQLGLIVGVGMVGGIAMRFVQGVGIDHYGAGRIWRWSTTIFAISLGAHLLLHSAYSPSVFIVRTIMQSSLAGIFGSSITFVSLRVRPQRMAEIIGTLGTSGFIGIMIGPLLSDRICGEGQIGARQIQLLFSTGAGIAALSGIVTWFATRHDVVPVRRRRPSIWILIHRYTLIPVAVVAVAMGSGFAIPMTFLRPFAVEMHFSHIGTYFAVYAACAFATRLATRRLFERHGTGIWMILGMACLTISFALYLPAQKTWHLFAPAAMAGVAHALLFPSVVSAGTTAFPKRYRGVATSMMLAMFDLGVLLGAPVVGSFLEYAKQTSDTPYSLMFMGVAATFLVITIFAALSGITGGPKKPLISTNVH